MDLLNGRWCLYSCTRVQQRFTQKYEVLFLERQWKAPFSHFFSSITFNASACDANNNVSSEIVTSNGLAGAFTTTIHIASGLKKIVSWISALKYSTNDEIPCSTHFLSFYFFRLVNVLPDLMQINHTAEKAQAWNFTYTCSATDTTSVPMLIPMADSKFFSNVTNNHTYSNTTCLYTTEMFAGESFNHKWLESSSENPFEERDRN